MTKCSVDGCYKTAKARGLCGTHYARWRNHGDPLKVLQPVTAHLSKGWQKTCGVCGNEFNSVSNKSVVCSTDCRFELYSASPKTADGCIEWSGPLNNSGYGVLSIGDNSRENKKRVRAAHRVAYEKANGDIPEGLCVMHTCDNRKCVNPEHLVLGTWADNNKDRSKKGRSGKRVFSEDERARYSEMLKGERNHTAKLTDEQVRQLILERGSASYRQLGKKYGVAKSVVTSIFNGRSWKHIGQEYGIKPCK